MLKVENLAVYKAFGLTLLSEIPLPELPLIPNIVDSIDIEIRIEDLSEQWKELSDGKNEFVISENIILFQITNIATFFIQEGKKIIVSPIKHSEEDLIRLYILGTCMGAILIQRKVLPLHGSAIAINGKAYAIIGDSGAGKSTLAKALLNQGCQLLSDDVIAVSISQNEGIPTVTPSYPQQKLWQDSLESFGLEPYHFKSIHGRENKYCVPVSSNYYNSPLVLAGIFELGKTEAKESEIGKIERLERFQTLLNHTYRNFFIKHTGLLGWHFSTSANIVDKVDMYKLNRPTFGYSTTELVSIILKTIDKGE
ncbi:hypothetical protein QFZ87_001476 [Bacillus sp. SLBN-46]|uniref:aldolase n=1 Tax=Bacillus sp. SLBN-46 TaxID=3042283 RepID=UPI0028602B8F|nr:aldolase [Bacillus sp. SLBN-46]MDR6121879.1 hypothetical protein [Bacillus sp. SLBN-46]